MDTNKLAPEYRGFRRVAFLIGLALLSVSALLAEDPGSIESIEVVGQFIRECSLTGETRGDDVVPRHANAIQLSASRWLVIYSTHGYRGVDDERSIVYQLRRDAPDGAVLKEGFLARGVNDWRPAGVSAPLAGTSYYKQHGHMVAFGVPKGAMAGGQPAPHGNLFVAKWRVLGRPLNLQTGFLDKADPGSALFDGTRNVEWTQFRLNEQDDDIEILEPAAPLRQKGFETGEAFCRANDGGTVNWMNQSFCPAVPVNADCTEWADANHFDGDRVAVLRYRFDPRTRRYEWIEMGALLGTRGKRFFEASLVQVSPKAWIVGGRGNGEVGWARSTDPFASWSPLQFAKSPAVNAPMTVFRCADGVVRLFSGDKSVSPTRNARDPLYCWEIDPDPAREFAATQRREIFSSVAAKLPIRSESQVKVDFCEVFPLHGRTQLVVFGVSTRAMNHSYPGYPSIPVQNAAEKEACGLYYARITYRGAPAAVWKFGR